MTTIFSRRRKSVRDLHDDSQLPSQNPFDRRALRLPSRSLPVSGRSSPVSRRPSLFVDTRTNRNVLQRKNSKVSSPTRSKSKPRAILGLLTNNAAASAKKRSKTNTDSENLTPSPSPASKPPRVLPQSLPPKQHSQRAYRGRLVSSSSSGSSAPSTPATSLSSLSTSSIPGPGKVKFSLPSWHSSQDEGRLSVLRESSSSSSSATIRAAGELRPAVKGSKIPARVSNKQLPERKGSLHAMASILPRSRRSSIDTAKSQSVDTSKSRLVPHPPKAPPRPSRDGVPHFEVHSSARRVTMYRPGLVEPCDLPQSPAKPSVKETAAPIRPPQSKNGTRLDDFYRERLQPRAIVGGCKASPAPESLWLANSGQRLRLDLVPPVEEEEPVNVPRSEPLILQEDTNPWRSRLQQVGRIPRVISPQERQALEHSAPDCKYVGDVGSESRSGEVECISAERNESDDTQDPAVHPPTSEERTESEDWALGKSNCTESKGFQHPGEPECTGHVGSESRISQDSGRSDQDISQNQSRLQDRTSVYMRPSSVSWTSSCDIPDPFGSSNGETSVDDFLASLPGSHSSTDASFITSPSRRSSTGHSSIDGSLWLCYNRLLDTTPQPLLRHRPPIDFSPPKQSSPCRLTRQQPNVYNPLQQSRSESPQAHQPKICRTARKKPASLADPPLRTLPDVPSRRLDSVLLRQEALLASRWLSFDRVLFGPAHSVVKSHLRNRVLVLDGLDGDDWAFYCAQHYPEATIYSLGADAPADAPMPSNYIRMAESCPSRPFPFPQAFFSAAVLRFPKAGSDLTYYNIIAEFKRVLRPGGHLEIMLMDMDLSNIGMRTRQALRDLKKWKQKQQPDASLRPLSESVQKMLTRKGFEGLNRCILDVPVAGQVNRSRSQSFEGRLPRAEETETDMARRLPRVGRWWYSSCYEGPRASLWADPALLAECETHETGFKMLLCYAQKPGRRLSRST